MVQIDIFIKLASLSFDFIETFLFVFFQKFNLTLPNAFRSGRDSSLGKLRLSIEFDNVSRCLWEHLKFFDFESKFFKFCFKSKSSNFVDYRAFFIQLFTEVFAVRAVGYILLRRSHIDKLIQYQSTRYKRGTCFGKWESIIKSIPDKNGGCLNWDYLVVINYNPWV